jgi:hypothetical protein
LIWGAVDINNQHRFFVVDNGNYNVKTVETGKISDKIPWKEYSIEGSASLKHTLTVIKLGDFTYFFIDDNYVDNLLDLPVYGNKVGFVVEGRQKIAVDSIRIYKIEAEGPPPDNKYLLPQDEKTDE